LNRAATLIGWALAALTADDARRPRTHMRLSAIYSTRYARTGVLAGIDQAIDAGEQAVARTADCPPQWLTTLSGAYQNRFPATGTVADLDRAIELAERSLAATRADDFALAGRQERLAAACWRRYGHQGRRADLDRAIDLGRQAVTATPDDHAGQPERMSGLAAALLARYLLDRVPADLEEAIGLGDQALARVPAEHPGRARLTASVAIAYLERVIAEGIAPDREELGELARSAAEARTAPPAERVSAHHALGALAQACGHPDLAATMLDSAIALLPSVAPREAGWADQHHRLGEHFGLVETAVAAHCALGDPAGAVEVAELGRGVLLAWLS
jgi:tetratricopeptide (TPR) repeat protein